MYEDFDNNLVLNICNMSLRYGSTTMITYNIAVQFLLIILLEIIFVSCLVFKFIFVNLDYFEASFFKFTDKIVFQPMIWIIFENIIENFKF